jgi:hypothetical protein
MSWNCYRTYFLEDKGPVLSRKVGIQLYIDTVSYSRLESSFSYCKNLRTHIRLFIVGDIRIVVNWEEIGLGHVEICFWCGIEKLEESNNVLLVMTSLVAES